MKNKLIKSLSFIGIMFILISALFVPPKTYAIQYELVPGNLLVRGAIANDWVPMITFTVGAESSDNIAVIIKITRSESTTIAKSALIRIWLSDTAGAAATSTAPDGSGTAANGWITSDGTEFEEQTGEIKYLILTGSDGDVTITLNDDDADNDWYVNAELDGIVYSSTVISHAL